MANKIKTAIKSAGLLFVATIGAIGMMFGLGQGLASADGYPAPGEVTSAQAAKTSGVADSGAAASAQAADVSGIADSGAVNSRSAANIKASLFASPTTCADEAWKQGPMPTGGTSAGDNILAESTADACK